jgi:hypothetical protein
MTEENWFLKERLEKAEWVLRTSGFRKCDIPACNCGSWHQVGGFKARFDEIKEVVEEADYSTNGRTLLKAVEAMASDIWQLKQACGYPIPADKETPQNLFKCGVCDARSLNQQQGKEQ